MLFCNLECFQGTGFIFLDFPESIRKRQSWQSLFWISERLTQAHGSSGLYLSSSFHFLVCLQFVQLFSLSRARRVTDSTENTGLLIYTLVNVNGFFPNISFVYYSEKKFPIT